MIASISHPDMPDYPAQVSTVDPQGFAPNYGECRITGWRLNKDFSIDFTATTTYNDMYDLEVGPKPADTLPLPLPLESQFAPGGWGFEVSTDGDGNLIFGNLHCGAYGDAVNQANFDVYYVDLSVASDIGPISCNSTATALNALPSAVPGSYILVDAEIMLLGQTDGTGTHVTRAQLGTTAAAHGSGSFAVTAINPNGYPCDIVSGDSPLSPGDEIVQISGGAEIAYVAEYFPDSHTIRTAAPINGVAVDDAFSTNARAWLLTKITVLVTLPTYFFSGAARAGFQQVTALPNAGVVAVSGVLQNVVGLTSPVTTVNLVTSPQGWLVTDGGTGFDFVATGVPNGDNADIFLPVTVPDDQAVEYAVAQITGGDTVPVPSPRAVGTVLPSRFGSSGSITLGGAAEPVPRFRSQSARSPRKRGQRPRAASTVPPRWQRWPRTFRTGSTAIPFWAAAHIFLPPAGRSSA